MTVYAVLDATHYPIAIFHSSDAAWTYANTRGPQCYVVVTKLLD